MSQYDPIAIKSGILTVLGTDTLRTDRIAAAGLVVTGLTTGDVCQVSGALTLAKAVNTSTSPIVGIYDGETNSVVRKGVVVATMKAGVTLANGDTVWLSAEAGKLTNVKPSYYKIHEVGVVVDAASSKILLQQKPVVDIFGAPPIILVGSKGLVSPFQTIYDLSITDIPIQVGDFGVLNFASAWTASDTLSNDLGWTWVNPGAMYASAQDSNHRFGMFAGQFLGSVPSYIRLTNPRGNTMSLHLMVYRNATQYTSATKLNTYPMPDPMLFPSMDVPVAGAWVLAYNGNPGFSALPPGAEIRHATSDGGHGWGELTSIHKLGVSAGATGVLSFDRAGSQGFDAAIAIVLQP